MRQSLSNLFLIALLLLCAPAFAACTATKIVCTAGGCDYSATNDAVTYMETNCATPTEPLNIKICSNASCDSTGASGTDTTAVGISGIGTSATNTLTIATYGSARHDGTAWKSGAYKNSFRGSSGTYNISVNSNYVTISGIILNTRTTNYTEQPFVPNSSTNVLVDSVIFENEAPTTHLSNGSVTYRNCVMPGITDGYWASNHSLTFKNVTFLGGLSLTYFTGASCTNCYASTYSGVTLTTSASSDNTGSVGLRSIAYSTSNFTNVTAGSEDIHLVSGSALIDVGTDLSASFTTDIDGETRSGTWDIGADERISVGGGVVLPNVFNDIFIGGELTVQ